MTWLTRMNAAIDYIEANLTGHIEMSVAARGACCSEYHFSRMFAFITGIPLSEYIRRRRLTLAGFELKNSNVKVIDLAHKYCYDSPNSFTRAFQALHGVTPSQARTPGVELKSFSRISFTISMRGDVGMDYRIVSEGEVTVFGHALTTKTSESFKTVPVFIDDCEEKRITNRIVEAGHGNEKTLLKSVIWDTDDGMMKYMLCLDMPECGVSDEFEVYTVPARTWAVFPLVIENWGEDCIISVWNRIFPEWFPNSGYEMDTGPRQERCHWRDDGKMVVEAWVPVTAKQVVNS